MVVVSRELTALSRRAVPARGAAPRRGAPAASALGTREHAIARVLRDGYDVTYDYRGHSYTTVMNRDPGNRVRLRVSVEPDQYQ